MDTVINELQYICMMCNHDCVLMYIYADLYENSIGLSSTTNPKTKGQPSISLPAQASKRQSHLGA